MAPMAVGRHDDIPNVAVALSASAGVRSPDPRYRPFALHPTRLRDQQGPAYSYAPPTPTSATQPQLHQHQQQQQQQQQPQQHHLYAHAPQEEVQLDQLPPLPVSPRWDSLSHSARFQLQQTSSGRNSPMYDSQPGSPSPYDASSVTSDSRVNSPTFPLVNKSSLADLRGADGFPIENFSRPRKQSLRQPITDLYARAPRSVGPPFEPNPELTSAPQPAPWRRPRGPSVSSCTSSSNVASPLPTPSSDFYEYRAPRARILNHRPPPLSYQQPIDFPPPGPGSAYITPVSTPWLNGEESRSSYRSHFTESTAPGTVATERSSIVTKASSIRSFYTNPDEPSLEDVMGMYEKGFGDDDSIIEETARHSRPVTSVSEPQRESQYLDDVDQELDHHDMSPQYRPTRRAVAHHIDDEAADDDSCPVETEIRKSKMIFFSAAYTASVPAIAENSDQRNMDKRDSGKSLESEPSVNSPHMPSPAPTPEPELPSGTEAPPNSPPRQGLPSNSKPVLGISTTPAPTASTTEARSPTPPPPITPTPMAMPVEIEEPNSRDRYGFKKQNQYITREQYDAWNVGYTEYLARRRRKWIAFLKDNALMTDRPHRFPAPSAKTKRFIRKGIPPDWRGAAWFYYAGGPAILAKHSGLYEEITKKEATLVDIEAVERDLHRTFPDNVKFKPPSGLATPPASERGSQSILDDSPISPSPNSKLPQNDGEPPIITSLRRVLLAFSVYNPRIGYCQSLNFLAGLLLLFVDSEEQCFWLLNVITRIYLPGTHEMNLEGSKVDLGVLMTELRETMPAVWDKIGGELEAADSASIRPQTGRSIRLPRGRRRDMSRLSTDRLPPITLCMTAWFMSCFIGTLPIESTLRVWDVFFYEGSKTLFRISLAIFKLGESEVKAVTDPMEMFGVVQSMPRRLIDANALMEATFKRRNGFGHLSQDTIDVQREERRHKAQQDRERLRQVKQPNTWQVTESDAELTRKGSFPLKKRRPTNQA